MKEKPYQSSMSLFIEEYLKEDKDIRFSCGDLNTTIVINQKLLFFMGRINFASQGQQITQLEFHELEDDRIHSVSNGEEFGLVLTEKGRVIAYGSTEYGQLGTTNHRNYGVFSVGVVQIPKHERVVQISAGGKHGLALTASGNVYAWGRNLFFQCGIKNVPKADNINIPILVRLPLIRNEVAISIAAIKDASLVVLSSGTIVRWGSTFAGQLAYEPGKKLLPSRMELKLKYETVSIQAHLSNHILATTSKGKVHSWGYNNRSQVTSESTLFSRSIEKPVLLDLPPIRKAWSYGYSSMALSKDGKWMCWGENRYNELASDGIEHDTNNLKVQYPVLPTFDNESAVHFDGGFNHCLFLTNQNRIIASGYVNYYNFTFYHPNTKCINAVPLEFLLLLQEIANSNDNNVGKLISHSPWLLNASFIDKVYPILFAIDVKSDKMVNLLIQHGSNMYFKGYSCMHYLLKTI